MQQGTKHARALVGIKRLIDSVRWGAEGFRNATAIGEKLGDLYCEDVITGTQYDYLTAMLQNNTRYYRVMNTHTN